VGADFKGAPAQPVRQAGRLFENAMNQPQLFNLHTPPKPKPKGKAHQMPGMAAKLRAAFGTSDGRVSAPVRTNVDTSREAGAVAALTARTNESIALSQIQLAGETGRTFDELATLNDWDSSQSGRCTALRDAGLIVDSGRRRKTRKGVSAVVWVASEPKEPI